VDRSNDRLTASFQDYRRQGRVDQRNDLVEEYLPLARGFARRFARRGVPLEDLEQVARLALIGAVERFDPEVGVRFVTFAGRTIEGELKRYFRDKAWSVKVPRQYQDLGIAVRNELERLTKSLERTPSVQEVAEAVGAEVDEVLMAMEASQAFAVDSIDAPIREDDGAATVADTLGEVDLGSGMVDDRDLVADLLGRLPDRERRILELRFFADRSQREIAEEIGTSQMHVSRLMRKALGNLRSSMDEL
jgi:RNA polymerase sigma-B factor